MNSYKLKLHGYDVAIKKVSEDTFVPKNTEVLTEVFNTKEFDPQRTGLYDDTPINKEAKRFHLIQSFCTVVTHNIKEECAILLKSLRQHHEQPVYIVCDKKTGNFLNTFDFQNIHYICTAEEPMLEKINEKYFQNLFKHLNSNFHKTAPILKKMEAMNAALLHNDNTFFLDTDIIILDSLQEKFTKEVCLSPHYYPKTETYKGFRYGFYNAGYIFTTSKELPNIWKWLYLNDSSFYEQEGMNRIPNFHRVEVFGKEHNFGLWRDTKQKFKLKSIHAHLSTSLDKDANDVHLEMNKDIRDYAFNYLKKNHSDLYDYAKAIIDAPKRNAFVHFGKCAGQYTENYMCSKIFKYYGPGYKLYNSFWSTNGKLDTIHERRDYTKLEFETIIHNLKEDDYIHVHGQHINWDISSVNLYKDNNFFMFTFLRDPRDLLCSLMHWSNEKNVQLSNIENPKTLNEMFEAALTNKGIKRLWQIPEYTSMLDSVKIFSHKNFGEFLYKNYGHTYKPIEKKNTSKNKGFDFYYSNGDIDKGLVEKFMKTDGYKEYYKYGLVD